MARAVGPTRLAEVVRSSGEDLANAWAALPRPRPDPDEELRRCLAAGVAVHILGDADSYPARLADDHEPPGVLFSMGDITATDRPSVAIVGTRRCTHYGLEVAAELGRHLAEAGVAVVSGLALGIDRAAHEGALVANGARPVGVVGSGLDVVYPRRHQRLWRRVAQAGVLVSEAPLGAPPEPWRFPLRNRIIAALADVVVVVESHATGGSMHTVQAAQERDRTVMAVPGSVRSKSSAGTNRLLAEGAAPVLDADDVLVALDLATSHRPHRKPKPQVDVEVEGRDAGTEAVLHAVEDTPTPAEDVVRRTGLPPPAVGAALVRLEAEGLVRSTGGWWERCWK